MEWLSDFVSLFFPPLCCGCKSVLNKQEKFICLKCFYSLEETNYHLLKDNPLHRYFLHAPSVKAVTSLYHYKKETEVQDILHGIKYKGREDAAFYLGRIAGERIKSVSDFACEAL